MILNFRQIIIPARYISINKLKWHKINSPEPRKKNFNWKKKKKKQLK